VVGNYSLLEKRFFFSNKVSEPLYGNLLVEGFGILDVEVDLVFLGFWKSCEIGYAACRVRVKVFNLLSF
jgi:hypothetical protein